GLTRSGGASGYGLVLALETTGGVFSSVSTSNIIALNVWSHVAVSFDGAAIRFYRNGSLINTGTANVSPLLNDIPVLLGTTPQITDTTVPFQGSLDEVRFYNLTLTDSQIAALH